MQLGFAAKRGTDNFQFSEIFGFGNCKLQLCFSFLPAKAIQQEQVQLFAKKSRYGSSSDQCTSDEPNSIKETGSKRCSTFKNSKAEGPPRRSKDQHRVEQWGELEIWDLMSCSCLTSGADRRKGKDSCRPEATAARKITLFCERSRIERQMEVSPN